MSDKPFMPKATAVWLVENTSLSFKQINDPITLLPPTVIISTLVSKASSISLYSSSESPGGNNVNFSDVVQKTPE